MADRGNAVDGGKVDYLDEEETGSLDPIEASGKSRRNKICVEFSEACCRGQLEEAKAIVESGGMDLAGVDGHGETPVHVAAGRHYCHEILVYLLEKGASFDRRDKLGRVPLHAAASSRNVVGIRQLLRMAAEVDVRDWSGCTPLFAACEATAYRAVEELLKGGADPTLVKYKDHQTPLHALLHSSQVTKKATGKSELSTPGTVDMSLAEAASALIQAGAPLTRTDRSGETVVDVAAACDVELLHYMLLKCKIKPTKALFYAIKHGDMSAAKELLDGEKVDPCIIVDYNGNSLLHVAAAHGQLECVKLLLTGAWLNREESVPLNIDARNSAGRTALFNASLNGFGHIVAFLLNIGASPGIKDGSGTGVGYTFADNVSDEQKGTICELLQRWGDRSGEERERAESSMSVKAPTGEVVLFSGEVAFVHSSKTKHLWADINHPRSPPAGVASRKAVHGEGVGQQRLATNPWRGRTIGNDTFQPIELTLEGSMSPTSEGAVGVGEESRKKGADRNQQHMKYAENRSARERRRKSLSFEDETESEERESRMASESVRSPGRKVCRGYNLSGKGRIRRRGSKSRRRRDHSDALYLEVNEQGERTRLRSTATESTDEGLTELSTSIEPWFVNQHRKLRPLATEGPSTSVKKTTAWSRAADDSPMSSTVTPSAPKEGKPSRAMKTFGDVG